jgi:hypothetical protein
MRSGLDLVQQCLCPAERGGCRCRVSEAAESACLDKLGEGQDPRGRVTPASVEGALRHVERLIRRTFEESVQGNGRQNVSPHLHIAARTGQPQRLDEVLLGSATVTAVERGPGHDAGQLRGDREQFPADLFGVGAGEHGDRSVT